MKSIFGFKKIAIEKEKRMNARQANRISIRNYLSTIGINPVRSNKSSSLYLAPYRAESNPSLKVSHDQNLWVDYGNDNKGGTLIDLVLQIHPSFTVSDAIQAIKTTTHSFFSFHQQNTRNAKSETCKASCKTRNAKSALPVSKRAKPDTGNETLNAKNAFGNSKQQAANSNLLTTNSSLLLAEQEIAKSYTYKPGDHKSQNLKQNTGIINSYYLKDVGNNPAITNYLTGRRVQVETSGPYCKEIYYQINNKRYFGLANKNTNGWSIRNKYWKGCTAQGYSYYKNGFEMLCVFEGIFDLLSFIELNKHQQIEADSLVLNSLVNLKRAIPIIETYSGINLFLDHDQAGRRATKVLLDLLPHSRDTSSFYSCCKDLNEYHLLKNKEQLSNSNYQMTKDNCYPPRFKASHVLVRPKRLLR